MTNANAVSAITTTVTTTANAVTTTATTNATAVNCDITAIRAINASDNLFEITLPSVKAMVELYNATTDSAERQDILTAIKTVLPLERDDCRDAKCDNLIALDSADFWTTYSRHPFFNAPTVKLNDDASVSYGVRATRLNFRTIKAYADDNGRSVVRDEKRWYGAIRVFGANLAANYAATTKGESSVVRAFAVDAKLWKKASTDLPDYFTSPNRSGQKALVRQLDYIWKCFLPETVTANPMYFDVKYILTAITSAKRGDITVRNGVYALADVIIDALDSALSFDATAKRRTRPYTVLGSDRMTRKPKESKTTKSTTVVVKTSSATAKTADTKTAESTTTANTESTATANTAA